MKIEDVTNHYEVVTPVENDNWNLIAFVREVGTRAPYFLKAKEDGIEALTNEAEVLGVLSHPQIPKLINENLDADVPYIVTEYMGTSVHAWRWMHEYKTPRFVAKLCMSALDPLAYVHERGKVHRDIKTKNLLLRMGSPTGLVDFELCLNEGDEDHQNISNMWGTPDYMAPERAYPGPTDHRSDIYSMGVVMYQLLYDALPVLGFHFHDDEPVPDELIEIILKATKTDPEDRYQTAREMQADINEYYMLSKRALHIGV